MGCLTRSPIMALNRHQRRSTACETATCLTAALYGVGVILIGVQHGAPSDWSTVILIGSPGAYLYGTLVAASWVQRPTKPHPPQPNS